MKILPLLLTVLATSLLDAKPQPTPLSVEDQMKGLLDQVSNTLYSDYAPYLWKNDHSDWSLFDELAKAKDKVTGSMRLKDYQRVVRDFVRTTHDYHVSALFYSTERATLPIRMKGASGRYFISWIDRHKLPLTEFPFHIGDEVLTYDGLLVDERVKKLQSEEVSGACKETDRMIAELLLSSRSGVLAHVVPQGEVVLEILSKQDKKKHRAAVAWEYEKEKILPPPFKAPLLAAKPSNNHIKEFSSPLAKTLYTMNVGLGDRKSFVPNLGKITWKTSPKANFHAYIFLDEKGRSIGYIRLPHYMAGEVEAQEFGELISFMNNQTAALVIDQVDNPGGSVLYLYALASMLSEEPLAIPTHRCSLTQETLMGALQLIEWLDGVKTEREATHLLGETVFFTGYPSSLEVVEQMIYNCYVLMNEWNQGRFLTDPLYLYGISSLNPHPYFCYSGKILVLINALDVSGGDFFPAILQDNKRATLFGSRTAGAGGYVQRTEFANRFGISALYYTGSLAERSTKKPIEDLGVTPDIFYSVTVDDLQNNYRGYQSAVLEALETLLNE